MLLSVICGVGWPLPAQSADEPTDPTLQFRPSEAREILQVLREYPVLTQERDSLRSALDTANQEIAKQGVTIAKQAAALSLDEQLFARLKQIDEARVKEVDIYKRIAAVEAEGRQNERERADRYEKATLIGTVVGTVLGIAVGVYAGRK